MEFTTVTLGEISKGKGQYGIGASAVDYSDNLYTYLRITDINDDGTLNLNDLKSVDDEKASQYVLQPNDIVFARTGNSTGRNYFYDGSDGTFVYAGFLIKFSIDPVKVNPRYIKYYCLSGAYKGWVQGHSTGSTRGNINAQTYANMEIMLPSREQQDAMVSVLDNLEAKRKNNNKINRNLEEQLRAFFKNLFRLNADASWRTIPLGDAVSLIIDHRGLTPKKLKSEWSDTGIVALSAKNVKNGKLVNLDTCNKVDDELYEKWMPEKLIPCDILMTSEAPLGEFYYLARFCKYCLSQRLFAIRADVAIIEPTVLYFQLSDPIGKSLIEGRQSGTTVTGIRQSELVKIPIVIPDIESQKKFAKVANPIMEKIEDNYLENQRLAQLRDALLPKLMSGELDVSDLDI